MVCNINPMKNNRAFRAPGISSSFGKRVDHNHSFPRGARARRVARHRSTLRRLRVDRHDKDRLALPLFSHHAWSHNDDGVRVVQHGPTRAYHVHAARSSKSALLAAVARCVIGRASGRVAGSRRHAQIVTMQTITSIATLAKMMIIPQNCEGARSSTHFHSHRAGATARGYRLSMRSCKCVASRGSAFTRRGAHRDGVRGGAAAAGVRGARQRRWGRRHPVGARLVGWAGRWRRPRRQRRRRRRGGRWGRRRRRLGRAGRCWRRPQRQGRRRREGWRRRHVRAGPSEVDTPRDAHGASRIERERVVWRKHLDEVVDATDVPRAQIVAKLERKLEHLAHVGYA